MNDYAIARRYCANHRHGGGCLWAETCALKDGKACCVPHMALLVEGVPYTKRSYFEMCVAPTAAKEQEQVLRKRGKWVAR